MRKNYSCDFPIEVKNRKAPFTVSVEVQIADASSPEDAIERFLGVLRERDVPVVFHIVDHENWPLNITRTFTAESAREILAYDEANRRMSSNVSAEN